MFETINVGNSMTFAVDKETNSVILTRCKSDDSLIILPATIGDYKVTAIGDGAFSFVFNLVEVGIPDTITKIGDAAFLYCTKLKCVDIPEGVTSIGRDAFAKCYSLSEITLPKGITEIGMRAFQSCSSLTHVAIPEGISKIEDYTFDQCSSLRSVIIPKSITEVSHCAFIECPNLKKFTVPNTLMTNDDLMEDLVSFGVPIVGMVVNTRRADDPIVHITNKVRNNAPATVTDENSFDGDIFHILPIKKKAIEVPTQKVADGVRTVVADSLLFEINEKQDHAILKGFAECSNRERFEALRLCIPSAIEGHPVTRIDNGAFAGCYNLTDIAFPVGLKSIGAQAFSGCRTLNVITTPPFVDVIEEKAFQGCDRLEFAMISTSTTIVTDSFPISTRIILYHNGIYDSKPDHK